MTGLTFIAVVLYGAGLLIGTAIALILFIDAGGDDDGVSLASRFALALPLWPIVLLVWLVRNAR